MLSTAAAGHDTIAQAAQTSQIPIVQTAQTSAVLSADATINQPVTLEKYVRTYYARTPALANIASCESHFKQFTMTGDVVRGLVDHDDIGIMQINSRYNGDTAKKLGYDIYTLDGNLAFGQWLYDHRGTEPWIASASCWSK